MEMLRGIPQVDQLLREVVELERVGPTVARWLVRREVAAARARGLAGEDPGDVRASVVRAVTALEERRLRHVINATGVVLHTNLGRAQLGADAVAAIGAAAGASTLEFDLATGERGARAPVAATLVAALCDAEDALVVNNNAAALLLALAALARDREVVVSRGEMIEIGGEFRLPDVMEASGAVLREVGTTNRTHLKDYRRALSDRTGLILKVHPSNYAIVGFTKQPSIVDLVELARAVQVPVLYDVGSGLLRPEEGALADEPDAATAIASGVDLVCFSGDKLLGGPQAGIIAGRADLVERCRRHPIARAVRADKLTLAALEATLWSHALGQRARVPTVRMLETAYDELHERASRFAASVGGDVVDGESVTGGGSLPGRAIPTPLVRIVTPRPERFAARLRAGTPPVVARVDREAVLIDLRTVPADEERSLSIAIFAARAPLEVRAATVEDADAIAALHVGVMQRAFRGVVADDVLDGYDVASFAQWRRRAIPERRADGGETFVALRDGAIAGFASGGAPRDGDVEPRTGELYALYVNEASWGTGAARALATSVERLLIERGYGSAVLWVFEGNGRARRFYERSGWRADGGRRENALFGGAIELRYGKLLPRSRVSGDVVIRPARPGEGRAIGAIEMAVEPFLGSPFPEPRSIAGRGDMWNAIIERGAYDDQAIWVAEREGRIVGYAVTGSAPRRNDPPHGSAELYAIGVLPSHHGKGTGRALLDAAIDHLRESGYPDALLWTHETNERARAFYERAGWTLDATTDPGGSNGRSLLYRLTL